jgi:hypothetical protein
MHQVCWERPRAGCRFNVGHVVDDLERAERMQDDQGLCVRLHHMPIVAGPLLSRENVFGAWLLDVDHHCVEWRLLAHRDDKVQKLQVALGLPIPARSVDEVVQRSPGGRLRRRGIFESVIESEL